MNEKLTLQDIIDILAKKAGMTKKDADAFFREFFAVISDTIFNNEPVKIKDFGTFKLTRVNSRESVDVNTGEKIEIPAHFKLSFVPDKVLKTLVNKPFSQFETTLLEEGVNFDSIEVSEEPAEVREEEDTAVDIIEPVVSREEKLYIKEDILEVKRQKTDIKTRIKEIEKADIGEPLEENQENISNASGENEPVQPDYEYTYTFSSRENKNESVTLIVNPEEETVKGKEIPTDTIKPAERTNDNLEVGENFPENSGYIISGENDSLLEEEWEEARQKIEQLQKDLEYWIAVKARIEVSRGDKKTKKNVTVNKAVTKPDTEFPEEIGKGEKFEDVTEEILKDTRDTGNLLENLVTVENVEEEKSVPFNNIQDNKEEIDFEEQEEYDLYDFHQETFASKFRRMLPITIFLLIIAGFGAYHFFKLFNNSPVYPSGWEYAGWRDTDTLPDGVIGIIPDSVYHARLEKINPELLQEDSMQVSGDISRLLPDDGLPANTGTSELQTVGEKETYDKVISDNLKIKVLRKANYQREKANPAGSNFQVLTEVVQRGATLRLIAQKYYGNNIFWVYIYEENKQRVPDFDNVPVGIELVIPEPKKYNIDPENPQSIEEAKRREQLIFNRIQL